MKYVNDIGPIYKETFKGKYFVEPLSTLSNLSFFFVFLYWWLKIIDDLSNHIFILLILILLFIGWIGGTIYHATRSHNLWIYLDIAPIVISCILATIYFWVKIDIFWFFPVILTILPILLVLSLKKHTTPKSALISYSSIALPIIIPIFIYMKISSFIYWYFFIFSLISFILALFFRSIDLKVNLKYGTHWLWHIFGAIAVFFILNYIFYL